MSGWLAFKPERKNYWRTSHAFLGSSQADFAYSRQCQLLDSNRRFLKQTILQENRSTMSDLLEPHLSENDVRFFQENGFLHVKGFLDDDYVGRLTAVVQEFIEGKQQAGFRQDLGGQGNEALGEEAFLQILGMWKSNSLMREIAFDRKKASLVAALSSCDAVRFLSDMILYKPGNRSRPTFWHQDYPNHCTSIPEITIWMPLDQATKASGCMWYVPGSHKLGELLGYDFGDGSGIEEKGIDVSKAVSVEADPGDLVLHHGLTLHYAGSNTTNSPRRAYINRLVDASAVYRNNELVDGSKAEVTGQPLRTSEHPVIFP